MGSEFDMGDIRVGEDWLGMGRVRVGVDGVGLGVIGEKWRVSWYGEEMRVGLEGRDRGVMSKR